jgi:hypothetical protein
MAGRRCLQCFNPKQLRDLGLQYATELCLMAIDQWSSLASPFGFIDLSLASPKESPGLPGQNALVIPRARTAKRNGTAVVPANAMLMHCLLRCRLHQQSSCVTWESTYPSDAHSRDSKAHPGRTSSEYPIGVPQGIRAFLGAS